MKRLTMTTSASSVAIHRALLIAGRRQWWPPCLDSRLRFLSTAVSSSPPPRKQSQDQQEQHLATLVEREKRLVGVVVEEEKQRLAVVSRQERQEAHVMQQHLADARKHQSRRKNAARSIPFWLGNDSSCLKMTMEVLNLPSRSPKRNKTKSERVPVGLWEDYKQLYMNSIPSFFQTLVPEKEEEGGEENGPLQSELDKLVDAGFDDLKWAKQYRKQMEYQLQAKRLNSLISKGQVKYKRRQAKLDEARRELERLQQQVHKTQQQEEPKKDQSSGGLLSQAINALTSLFGTTATDKEALSKDDADKDISQGDREKLNKQKTIEEQAEKAVENARLNLKRMNEELDSYKFEMSSDEYDRANQVVQEIMPRICQELASHIHKRHAKMIEQYRVLDSKTDLTKPHDWYLHARLDRRKIIFHAGPTNSGKTYTALERLKTAKRGLYLGPLRLLAAEIYETLTSAGVYTNLFTGQEKREIPFATHIAATVEMAPTTSEFDLVVIDEIQMIADPERGFAWTRALMGIRCKEIHLCGGFEAKNIVEKIAEVCGDELEILTYKRFSALNVQEDSLSDKSKAPGSYTRVQPGDCVVAFSRNDIFAIKREIESGTNYKCCVIYGSLPPQTRTDQARRFNDPNSGYDILVASDAIGMGLNLNIRRIIFNSLFKYSGERISRLDHSSVKQIAGRAGRRNSPFPEGEVTCRDPEDMEYLKRCMSTEIRPIEKAGLLPTSEHIELFSEALKTYDLGNYYDNLDKILREFSEMATVKGDFFLCKKTPMQVVAKSLNDIDLPLKDKYTLCMSPVKHDCPRAMGTLKQFAMKQSLGQVSGLNRTVIPRSAKSFDHLSQLCSIHSQLELFLWLHFKFPGSNVMEQRTALVLKEQTIALINKGLAESERLQLNHCYVKRDAGIRAEWKGRQRKKRQATTDELDDFLPHSEYLVDEI